MRKNIFKTTFIFTFLVFGAAAAFAFDEAYYTFTPTAYSTNDSYPKLAQIEHALLKRNYDGEDIYKRLDRLEQKMFKTTHKDMNLAQRVDNVIAHVTPSMLSQVPKSDLNAIENKLFNKTFNNEDAESRIIRIEKEMLGAMQYGSLDERFETLKTASAHYTPFPVNPYNNYTPYTQAYYPPSSSPEVKTNFKNFLGNLRDSFFGVGTMTGYTPPVYDVLPEYGPTPYNGYDPYMMQQQPYYNGYGGGYGSGYGAMPGYQSSNGFYNSTRSYGMGSGVRIFD